ncbi:RecB family exonuclease [Chloroflexota bacterium]
MTGIELENLSIKEIRKVSPSRYTAMQECLLREIWATAGNKPILPPSPLAELGSVIHQLLELAGKGQLENADQANVNAVWEKLLSTMEKKMLLSELSSHLVPLNQSIADFEVRKLRACRLASEIAQDSSQHLGYQSEQSPKSIGFELWVENDTGEVGGYIDRVIITEDSLVLYDYKSGAVMESKMGIGPGKPKESYKVQLLLYAALYHNMHGIWPVHLEIIPLQGNPLRVVFERKEAENLLNGAVTFLHSANYKVAQVRKGSLEVTYLASPEANHCRFCLFRPACHAYWTAREQNPEEKWPADVRGFLKEIIYLRNGKVCMRISEEESCSPNLITIRNLSNNVDRHTRLPRLKIGSKVSIYGLEYNHRSNDYRETQNTVIYG